MAPRGPSEDPKVTALRESRCLNPHPEQVTDDAHQPPAPPPLRKALHAIDLYVDDYVARARLGKAA
jgi:hypothetical protein